MTSKARDLIAASAAERVYREAYERLCELAQVEKPTRPLTARRISARAVIALRAYRSASRPPGPILPASTRPCCLDCAAYLAAPPELKPVPLEEAML